MARYSLTGSSFIVCLYKGKENAWKRGESRVLKPTKQVMKVLERIMDCLIRHLVFIDDSQFGFVPGRDATDAVIVVTQLRVYLATNKRFYMAFVDLEKAFDGVPRKVIRWALRKLGVDCVTGVGDVCQWAEPCLYLWGVQWRVWSEGLMFTKTRYSACCSSSLCLKPCHTSSALGSPGRTFIPVTL